MHNVGDGILREGTTNFYIFITTVVFHIDKFDGCPCNHTLHYGVVKCYFPDCLYIRCSLTESVLSPSYVSVS